MVIFDLREEARLVSQLYVLGGVALAFGAAALAPASLRRRLPATLAEAVRPLALVFVLATAVMAWVEHDERQRAEALVAQCWSGACTVVEGWVHGVEPVHKVSSGGRWTAPLWAGYFNVGGSFYAHSPRDYSDYSPANSLRDGDWARVYSQGEYLVLVDVGAFR
ncbi:MAG: hypothetical protein HQL39_06895 [Alphaproteobacteria bacterium]|nr:hypothetical protein [Alphaproteobacteria bacterium]